MNVSTAVNYLNKLLSVELTLDYSNALNGLQVENDGKLSQIGAAVDASEWTIKAAQAAGIDFLIVHHGLFWSGLQPITGAFRRKLNYLLEANMAVYSSHLPLDAHPEYGNNALLSVALGFSEGKVAFLEKGTRIGQLIEATIAREELCARLEAAVGGTVKAINGGPKICRRIGIITGGAGTRINQSVHEEKIDTLITGEGAHWTFSAAEELGVNLLYAGHYATETFGVKALAAHLSQKYSIPWRFIDHPSGL